MRESEDTQECKDLVSPMVSHMPYWVIGRSTLRVLSLSLSWPLPVFLLFPLPVLFRFHSYSDLRRSGSPSVSSLNPSISNLSLGLLFESL